MKKIPRLLLTAFLVLAMVFVPAQIKAEDSALSDKEKELIGELLLYYTEYRNDGTYRSEYTSAASYDIDRILNDLTIENEYLGKVWKEAIAYWDSAIYPFKGFKVNRGVLPDGLPNDDSMVIVCLGYQLNPDGSMKDELIGRLEVLHESWKKYPNAYVAVTGGGTAENNPNVTEGGAMKKWLLANTEIPEEKIILEDSAMDTYGNAANTYTRIQKDYPQITNVAIVTSEYHVPRGCVLFQIQFLEKAAENKEDCRINVISNAGFYIENEECAENGGYEDFEYFYQVFDIPGVELDWDDWPPKKPELSAAGDELNISLKNYKIKKGEKIEIESASFPIVMGDAFNDDTVMNIDPSKLEYEFDSKKTGKQNVTFKYTWMKDTIYEKTISSTITVNVEDPVLLFIPAASILLVAYSIYRIVGEDTEDEGDDRLRKA